MRSRTVQPLRQRQQRSEIKQNRRRGAVQQMPRTVKDQRNLVRVSSERSARPSRAMQPVARSGQRIGSDLAVRKKKRGFWSRLFVQDAQYFDYDLLLVIVFLMCFGLVMLYSTSAYSAQNDFGNDMAYFSKQAIIGLASFAWMLFVSRLDYLIYGAFLWRHICLQCL